MIKEERKKYNHAASMKKYNAKPENKIRKKAYMIKYTANPEIRKRKNAHMKEYNAKSEIKLKRKIYYLKKDFNITLEEYNLIFNNQNGCCAICGKHQSEFKKALHVDHNHENGKVRGLLCMKCNSGIGFFYDNLELLNNVIKYLKNYATQTTIM